MKEDIEMKTLAELKIWMDEPKVIQMAIEIGKILENAHRNGKIHGDIRPEHIFVDDQGNYQLEGWGIETVTESNEHGVCMQIKDNYRSPQQHKDGVSSVKGDLYSFGLILYQWMNGNVLPFYPTGKKIVTYSDRRKALEKRMEGEIFSPLKDTSAKFSKIIFKLCAYDEMNRYESAEYFLKDLGVSVDSGAKAEEERKRAEAKAKAEEERKKAEAKAKAEEERKRAEAKAEEERKKAEAEVKIEERKEVAESSGIAKQRMVRYIAAGAAGVLILVGGILIGTSMGDKENNNSLVTGTPTNDPSLTPTVMPNSDPNIQEYDDGDYGTLLIRYDEETHSLYRLRKHADGTVIYEYNPEKLRFPYDIAMEYYDGMLFSTTSLEKYFIEQGKTVWTTYRFWDSGHRRYALNGEDVGTDSMDLDCDIECIYTYGEKNSHKITNAVFVLNNEQGVEEWRLEYRGDRLLQCTYWTWYDNGRTKTFGDYTYNDDLETPGYEYVHQDYECDATVEGIYDEKHRLVSWNERFTDKDGNDVTISYKDMFHREQ